MHFEEIYRQNYQLVFRLANKIVRDKEVSKDISQEIFIKLYRVLDRGMSILNVQGWLCRITVNHCYNHVRDSNRRQPLKISKEAEDREITDIDEIEHEKIQRIQRMMLRLRENEQLVLVLYGEGMSYREIAEASGIPFNSVGKTLTRALSKLKKLCHDDEYPVHN